MKVELEWDGSMDGLTCGFRTTAFRAMEPWSHGGSKSQVVGPVLLQSRGTASREYSRGYHSSEISAKCVRACWRVVQFSNFFSVSSA